MILISNPIALPQEIAIIHSLFEEGMELFHVRKPVFCQKEMKKFITDIALEYRNKLVLHSHHELASALGINRIHFTTNHRIKILEVLTRRTKPCRYSLKEYKNMGFTVSTSTHAIEEFNTLDPLFDAAFLSPIYKSISKLDYHPTTDWFTSIKKRTLLTTKMIALGGIEATNIRRVLDAGFDDVALLGTIWNSSTPLKNFKSCQKIALSL